MHTTSFKQAVVTHTLSQSDLFCGLAHVDLERIAQFTVVKPLEKGAYLFRDGDPSHGFYIVQSGCINLHRVNAKGKEQVIHFFRDGESLGVATLASATVCPAHARAEEPSQVLIVMKNDFVALLTQRPDLVLRVLNTMCVHCRVMSMHIDDLTLQNVETRLCGWLIQRCPNPSADQPVEIKLTASKRVLAAELGTISETLSRTLGHLRKQGLLSVNGRSITVHSPARLAALLNDEENLLPDCSTSCDPAIGQRNPSPPTEGAPFRPSPPPPPLPPAVRQTQR